jgi:hypothetical protein
MARLSRWYLLFILIVHLLWFPFRFIFKKILKMWNDRFVNELIEIWASIIPATGYIAGLESSKGKLFIPTPGAIESILKRIDSARRMRHKVFDPDIRAVGVKLLDHFQVLLEYSQPYQQLIRCLEGIFYILINNDEKSNFVTTFLNNVENLIDFETSRWSNQSFNIVIRRLCFENAIGLQFALSVLEKRNLELSDQINSLNKKISEFIDLFLGNGIDTGDLNTLLKLFEQDKDGPYRLPEYEKILKKNFDFPTSPKATKKECLSLLNEEMQTLKELAEQIANQLNLPPNTDIETIYEQAVNMKYPVGQGEAFIVEANRMRRAVDGYTAEQILELNENDDAKLFQTPDYLVDFITSGATLFSGSLTKSPNAIVYLSPTSIKNQLTMLNVLVHEFSHAFQFVKAARKAKSPLLKLENSLIIPLAEGMAFHREWEFYDAACKLLSKQSPTPAEEIYLGLFGSNRLEREQKITAFEMETRIWRVLRFLRAICDLDVNQGKKRYIDFLNWAHMETGLNIKRIHDGCFVFLAMPGYTPTYGICGSLYSELQGRKVKEGMPVHRFNTEACNMGLYPWTISQRKMEIFS